MKLHTSKRKISEKYYSLDDIRCSMPRLIDIGERNIVADMIKKFDPVGACELGDDCGILDMGHEYLLVTTDMITQATHMPAGSKPGDIGWYAAAINLSDIAAMGGEPMGMLFALGLPRDMESEWLESLTSGILDCCSSFGVPVLGGDTKENSSLTISGTAFGRVPKDQILRRCGAKPGDIIAMTGKLGRGVLWERNMEDASLLLKIEPRLNEGVMLAASGAVTSCIDMSDGLSTSLHHLSRSSKVGFRIEFPSIPMMNGLDLAGKMKALHYGGDYELLFTINPTKAEVLMEPESDTTITQIGQVTEDMAVLLSSHGELGMLPDKGYEHFRKEGHN
jgi:thiamine-monophosphate kinase